MNSEKYIGLDVHQATISVAVMDSTGDYTNYDGGEFLSWLPDALICYHLRHDWQCPSSKANPDRGTYAVSLYDRLHAPGRP